MQQYGTLILRVGLGLMLLWFGISELLDPEYWGSYVPEYLREMTASALPWVYANAALEIITGILLILGLWVRWVALLAGVHIALIAVHLGYNEIAIRDWALACMGIGLAFLPEDSFSLTRLLRKPTVQTQQ